MISAAHQTEGLSLRDLIVPGPVDRGLYFLHKREDTASRIQERLVDVLWWDSVARPGAMTTRLAAWFGAAHPSSANRHHRRQSRIGSLYWIDTGRSFDLSRLMVQARHRGLDTARVARAVRVLRPGGLLDYLDALERIPNAALCALGEDAPSSVPTVFSRDASSSTVGDGFRAPSSIWWTPMVVITELLAPLKDPRVPPRDAQKMAEHIYERLVHLRNRAVVVAVVGHTAETDSPWATEILRLGTRVGDGSWAWSSRRRSSDESEAVRAIAC